MLNARLKCIAVVAHCFGVASLATAFESASPARVLERMRQAQSELTTLVARIEQVKSHPQLGIEDAPERGDFYLARRLGRNAETRVRMEIQEPETRVLMVRGESYLLYQPRIKQAIEGRLVGSGKTGLFSGILTGSSDALAALEKDYELAWDEPAVTADAFALRFTARKGAAVYCRRIDLRVDKRTLLPVRQSCHEANESVVTFTLSEMTLDGPLDEALFEIDLPDGVEKVKG